MSVSIKIKFMNRLSPIKKSVIINLLEWLTKTNISFRES